MNWKTNIPLNYISDGGTVVGDGKSEGYEEIRQSLIFQ